MSRHQRGHVYEAFSAFHVQYYQTEVRDGKQQSVRKSHRLCAKDRTHYSPKCKLVQDLCVDFMRSIRDVVGGEDMTIADFLAEALPPVLRTRVQRQGHEAIDCSRLQTDLESVLPRDTSASELFRSTRRATRARSSRA